MGWVTGIAVYVVIWWLVLFMVLPWGQQPVDTEDVAKGHASSAPKKPRLLFKMLVTTAIAGVFWGIFYLVAESGLFSFRA